MPRLGSASAPGESPMIPAGVLSACLSAGLAAAARGGLDAWDLLETASQRFTDRLAVVDTGAIPASVPPAAGTAPKAAGARQQRGEGPGGPRVCTYGQLYQRSTALAGFLHRSGVRRGDMVAFMLRNCSQVCVQPTGVCRLMRDQFLHNLV